MTFETGGYFYDTQKILAISEKILHDVEALDSTLQGTLSGAAYWNESKKVDPREPEHDYDLDRPTDPETLEEWLDKNFPRYLVVIDGAEVPTILYYAGDSDWIDERGIFYNVRYWQELPEVPEYKQIEITGE